ncbi:MAG: riboflavin synthase [Actinobacteria bacterium]|nr:riboflavin synthase [Actinomycetota bacterium]
MFTGIVEELGRVVTREGSRLRIAATTVLEGSEMGASIAVNGCCLTLVATDSSSWWEADVSAETYSRTNLGSLSAGDPVNLERPMALGERLGGHIVLGHVAVDGISLTAFDLTTDTFRVAVIPHTMQVTTLGVRKPGDQVNIEMDVLAKHVERLVEPHTKRGFWRRKS